MQDAALDALVFERELLPQPFQDSAAVQRQCDDRADVRVGPLGSALAQERGTPQPLHWIEARPEQQWGVGSPEPLKDLAGRRRVGPRLGMTDRDLAAVGQTGFQCRAASAVDDDDLVPCRA